MIKFS